MIVLFLFHFFLLFIQFCILLFYLDTYLKCGNLFPRGDFSIWINIIKNSSKWDRSSHPDPDAMLVPIKGRVQLAIALFAIVVLDSGLV